MLSSVKVLLRPFRQDDFQAFSQITSDPEVTKYLGGPMAKEVIKDWFHNILSGIYKPGIIWAVVDKDHMKFSGFVSLSYLDQELPEVSITMAQKLWGKEYALEAIRLCLHYSFEKFDTKGATANIQPDNREAKKLFHKLGFRFKRNIFIKGKTFDHYELEP